MDNIELIPESPLPDQPIKKGKTKAGFLALSPAPEIIYL
jgi:hypothetical protein